MTWLTTAPTDHPVFTKARWADARWQHHAVMSLFGDLGNSPEARREGNVLFRHEPDLRRVLIQSAAEPVADGVKSRPMAPVFASYAEGATVRLLLTANTVRTINRTAADGTVRTHRARINEADLPGWLKQRLDGAASPFGHIQTRSGQLRNGHSQIITTTFACDASVTEPEGLVVLCRDGIGRAKSYGCGLLTALPVKH